MTFDYISGYTWHSHSPQISVPVEGLGVCGCVQLCQWAQTCPFVYAVLPGGVVALEFELGIAGHTHAHTHGVTSETGSRRKSYLSDIRTKYTKLILRKVSNIFSKFREKKINEKGVKKRNLSIHLCSRSILLQVLIPASKQTFTFLSPDSYSCLGNQ